MWSPSSALCPNCDVAVYSEYHRHLKALYSRAPPRNVALVGYELLLTCGEEIDLFRETNKRIIPMLLFLANRLNLVGYVVTQPLCIH